MSSGDQLSPDYDELERLRARVRELEARVDVGLWAERVQELGQALARPPRSDKERGYHIGLMLYGKGEAPDWSAVCYVNDSKLGEVEKCTSFTEAASRLLQRLEELASARATELQSQSAAIKKALRRDP